MDTSRKTAVGGNDGINRAGEAAALNDSGDGGGGSSGAAEDVSDVRGEARAKGR
jgi:hypothetical protein